MADPRVSCVIPSYNYARFLPRAIDSVLSQRQYTPESLEIIVIDDGSTDETPQVVEPYVGRINYVRKENGGLISAIERGLMEASGEYIALLDADDYWASDKLRRQLDVMLDRPDVGLVYTDMAIVDVDGQLLSPSLFAAWRMSPLNGRVFGQLLTRNCVPTTLLVRGSLKHTFVPIRPDAPYADWWIALRTAEVAELAFLPEPLAFYRHHGANMGMGASAERHVRHSAREIVFRRTELLRLEPGQITPAELMEAHALLEGHLNLVANKHGIDAGGPLEADPSAVENGAAAYTRASNAAGRGEARLAFHYLLQAVTLDPWHQRARQDLRELTIDRPLLGPDGRPCLWHATVALALSGRCETASNTISALRRSGGVGQYELVAIIDDDADAHLREFLQNEEAAGHLRVVRAPSGVDAAQKWNVASQGARGIYLVTLCDEVRPQPGWLSRLLDTADAEPRYGVVGARINSANGEVRHAGISLTDLGIPCVLHEAEETEKPQLRVAVAGGCLLLRRDVLARIGGFDASYSGALAEIDLCLRVWQSDMVAYSASSVLQSETDLESMPGVAQFVRNWAGRWPKAVRELAAPAGLVDGLRAFVTVARLDDLMADPRFLAEYAQRFTADDDATLLIYAPRRDAAKLAEQVDHLVQEAGLDVANAPDMLALPVALTRTVEDVLSHVADATLGIAS